jgi:hypothetical protein
MDVWRLKTNAVAVLGREPSPEQFRLLLDHFRGRPIAVFFDRSVGINWLLGFEFAQPTVEALRNLRRDGGDESPVVLVEPPLDRK